MNLIAARNKLDKGGEGQVVDMCTVYYDKTYEEVTRKVYNTYTVHVIQLYMSSYIHVHVPSYNNI